MTRVHQFIYAVATSFARAFASNFAVIVPGILAAPNRDAAVAASIAGLSSSIAAGLRALQFTPGVGKLFTWSSIVRNAVIAGWLDSFSRAFAGSFLTFWQGWFLAPDYGAWKAALAAGTIGIAAVALRAIQAAATPGETANPVASPPTQP